MSIAEAYLFYLITEKDLHSVITMYLWYNNVHRCQKVLVCTDYCGMILDFSRNVREVSEIAHVYICQEIRLCHIAIDRNV